MPTLWDALITSLFIVGLLALCMGAGWLLERLVKRLDERARRR